MAFNMAPRTIGIIAQQSATVGTEWSYTVPVNSIFYDRESGAAGLSYSVQMADGSAWPTWLTFDPTTWTFKGTPPAGVKPDLGIKIIGDDGGSIKASTTFQLAIGQSASENKAPIVSNPFAVKELPEDTDVLWRVPDDTFSDPDSDGKPLSLSVVSTLPSWLSFNEAARIFTGTPPKDSNDSYDITLRAMDAKGAWVDLNFKLSLSAVNDAPKAKALDAKVVNKGDVVTYTLPAGTFFDVDKNDTLTISVDERTLPPGMSFVNGVLTGKAPTVAGDYAITFTAKDIAQASVTTTLVLRVGDSNNSRPVLEGTGVAPAQSVDEDNTWSYTFPKSAFSDKEGDALTYKAFIVDKQGNRLSEISKAQGFDQATGLFSYKPEANFNGDRVIKVFAYDNGGESAEGYTINLKVNAVNDLPTAKALTAKEVNKGDAVTYQLPTDAFTDIDGDSLTITIDGTTVPLKNWSFTNGLLTGTAPTVAGDYKITFTAMDASKMPVTNVLTLKVGDSNNLRPVLEGTGVAPAQSVNEDSTWSYTFPKSAFSDKEGDALTYKAFIVDKQGNRLSEISKAQGFDQATGLFSYKPEANFNGDRVIKVFAYDNGGESAEGYTINLKVNAVNDLPTAKALAVKEVNKGDIVTYTLPADAFADVDGDTLAIDVNALTLPLSNWSFAKDPATGNYVLTGKAPTEARDYTITFIAKDDSKVPVTNTLTLRVGDSNNSAPTVLKSSFTAEGVDEDQTLTWRFPVSEAFSDKENDALTYKAVVNFPDGTSRTLSSTEFDPNSGLFNYKVDANKNGALTFTITASDKPGRESSPVTVKFNVNPVNDAPTVVTSTLNAPAINEDSTFGYQIEKTAFKDVDDATLTYKAYFIDPVSNVRTLLTSDQFSEGGKFNFTPKANYNGPLTFEVYANDGEIDSARPVTVNVTVNPVNDAPTVVTSTLNAPAINEDSTFGYQIEKTAFNDVDNATLTYKAYFIDPVSNARTLLSSDQFSAGGKFNFTPKANYNGPLTFEVYASDGEIDSARPVTVNVTVNPVNDAPTVVTPLGTKTYARSSDVRIDLANNIFTDVEDGSNLTYLLNASKLPAGVSFDGKVISGKPTTAGTYTIDVTAQDKAGGQKVETLTLIITDGNRAPQVVKKTLTATPIDEDKMLVWSFDTSAFNDPDGDAVTYKAVLVDQKTGARTELSGTEFDAKTGQFTYTPKANENGILKFEVTAIDKLGAVSEPVTVSLTVRPVNDAPTAQSVPLNDVTLTPGAKWSFTVPDGFFTDVDGDALSFDASGMPSWLSFSMETKTFSGRVPAGWSAPATLTVFATDNKQNTTPASTSFKLSFGTNLPPEHKTLKDETRAEDTDFNYTIPSSTFSDPEGQKITLTRVTWLDKGEEKPLSALSANLKFDPVNWKITGTLNANEYGDDYTFKIYASDGLNEVFEKVKFTVTAVNDKPVAKAISDKTVQEDAKFPDFSVASAFSDVDKDTLTYAAVAVDKNGAEVGLPAWLKFNTTTATFSGTPDKDLTSAFTIRVKATDGKETVSSDFKLTVANVNDVPVLKDDSVSAPRNGTKVIEASELLANDSDADLGDVLTITSVQNPINGSVALTGSRITFTPVKDYVGDASFTYTVSDGHGGTSTAKVNVKVNSSVINGTEGPDIIVGTDGDDIINGNGGHDTIVGGGGNDTIDGGVGNDKIDGGAGDDSVIGGKGDDSLTGGDGKDTLVGGDGNDTLIGGAGDDTFDCKLGDIVGETPGGGTDLVITDNTLGILWDNVENVTLTGTGDIDGTGNALNNVVTGNSGNNKLEGLAGNDSLIGGAGNDSLDGGIGADTLDGGVGNDTLRGGVGADSMKGGLGDDTYYVDDKGDVVDDEGGANDTVYTTIDYTLGNGIENLLIDGDVTGVTVTGNTGNNTITGNGQANTINGGGGNDTMRGGGGNDTLNGGDGNDILEGGDGNDSLLGGGGNDRFLGGPGDDIMRGDIGNDFYQLDSAGDRVFEGVNGGDDTIESSVTVTAANAANVETIILTGAAAINATGDGYANTIIGNSAANTIDGGAGADTMKGGGGNDIYYVDNKDDAIVETADGGDADLVYSSAISYALSDNVENGVLLDTGLDIAGNAGNNTLTGNYLSNRIDGGAGNDTMSGGRGADTLDGGAGADLMKGGSDNDLYYVDNKDDVIVEDIGGGTDLVVSTATHRLAEYVEDIQLAGTGNIDATGNTGNNSLKGNSGNNVLDGGVGIDAMEGGLGDDTYVIDNTGDWVIELANAGNDTIKVNRTYSLVGTNVENLVLYGDTAMDGTGSDVANRITGNASNNKLDGGAGNDTLDGGGGNDTFVGGTGADLMTGGSGDDTYYVDQVGTQTDLVVEALNAGNDKVIASVNYKLTDNVETLELTGSAVIGIGNALNNQLSGTDAVNRLDGLGGADRMEGLGGSDTYIVDDIGDVVVEAVGGGDKDLVASTVSYTLSANVEELELLGEKAIDGTGNNLANRITGNAQANVIDGKEGADTMIGGAGDDTYTVDSDKDVIIEKAGEGSDTVRASYAYALSGNIENLELLGTVKTGTGSSDANKITGNASDNYLDGGAGNDTLIGNGGNDTFVGGAGDDRMEGGTGNDTYYVDSTADVVVELANATDTKDLVYSSVAIAKLWDNVENLTLEGDKAIDATGNSLNNEIIGNKANNVLTGGAGRDTMKGGAGDDTYYVDDTNDSVVENAGEGNDTIFSTATYAIKANVETLILTGTANIDAFGDDSANLLKGNDGDNTLDGKAGNDSLEGGLGNDSLLGGAGVDTLVGGLGKDTLDGGLGDDILEGGLGDDTYVVDSYDDIVTEYRDQGTDTVQTHLSYTLDSNVENLVLTGTANVSASGNALNNTLVGNAGANILDGFKGADTMKGGAGNDLYKVDNAGDLVVENFGEGNDTIESSLAIAKLADNVENLVLTASTDLDGAGNDLDNNIKGNAYANKLEGGLGKDTLDGWEGNDTLDGGLGADSMSGGVGDDLYIVNDSDDLVKENLEQGIDRVRSSVDYTLTANVEKLELTDSARKGTGNDLNNEIRANAENNWLDGGAGADTLIGGKGDDTYVIDNAGDVATELAGEGTDTIRTSVNGYGLAATFENLTLIGSALTGYGNAGDNVLTGNELDNVFFGQGGKDTFAGGKGNDTYLVDSADDVTDEKLDEGYDTVSSTTASYTLMANVEKLELVGNTGVYSGTGNDLANQIVGNSFANLIDGSTGADTMSGGGGDDIYIVDNTGDVVTENVGEGTDTIKSSVTYTLSANVETLELTGNAAINATGNGLRNLITGNSANNIIDGGADADTMKGGAGDDTYIVDNMGDGIEENAGEGIDTVFTSTQHYLSANVENLTQTGWERLNGFGNELNNVMKGNDADSWLRGNGGNDTLDGGKGVDRMWGGTGDDLYYVDTTADQVSENWGEGKDMVVSSANNYTLSANIENLSFIGLNSVGYGNTLDNVMKGASGRDTLWGHDGNDTLDGGYGADNLYGQSGNDTYYVDNSGDMIEELSGQGWDTVFVSIGGYTMAVETETGILTGTDNYNLTGTKYDNQLYGNSGDNLLYGEDGNDYVVGGAGNDGLYGGYGNDTLDGGTGNDVLYGKQNDNTFIYKTGYGSDIIVDFYAGSSWNDQVIFSMGSRFDTFNEVMQAATEQGNDVQFDFGNGDILRMYNTKIKDFRVEDFKFV